MRWNAYFGRLQGHLLSPNPFFHGEKISFKTTRNLEFGFTRTVVVGGEGRPLTPYRLFLTYFSATSYFIKPANKDPGKRDGGFDFSYRVPLLREWLTIYNNWEGSALVQYEQWRFPLLAPALQKNVTASVQLVYWPQIHNH